ARDASALLVYFNESEGANYSDLYVSFPTGENKWSRPQPIDVLNTRFDEFGPYLAPDNRTLYFSSNRPGGYGSADIYKTVRQDDTWFNWSTPENIGEPVNTGGFDAYYAVGNSDTLVFTTRAHMSADGGHLDIYSLRRIIKEQPVVTLVATVASQTSGDFIPNATLGIFQESIQLASQEQGTLEGQFEMMLPGKGFYSL